MLRQTRTLLAALVAGLALVASALPARAVIVPIGGGGGGGAVGGGGGTTGSGGTTTTTAPACSPGFFGNSNTAANWIDVNVQNVNDVATGADGSIWYITGTPDNPGSTVRLGSGSARINGSLRGGKRIAVDPQGNPWIVDFSGNIYRLVNGAFQQLPGSARDIGIGADGAVWVVGTNSRNGSFQVYSWNGSAWVADPGSGEEIAVAANGDPVVNGDDGKAWIKNGGADQGWSQLNLGGVSVFDMGLSPCNTGNAANPGGSAMWFVNPVDFPGNFAPTVWSLVGSLQGPSTGLNSGVIIQGDLHLGQIEASHVAVDIAGRVWGVADPGACDCAGDLIERSSN